MEIPNTFQQKYHFCFYIAGMTKSKGGIERLGAILGNWLIEQGYRISIIDDSENGNAIYPLDIQIKIYHRPLGKTPKQIQELKSLLVALNPDVFIPMLSERLFEDAIKAVEGTNIKLIVSEHNSPFAIMEHRWNKDSRIETFKKADAIHLLLDSYVQTLPEYLRERTVVINNPIEPPPFNDNENLNKGKKLRKILLSVGRLSDQKKFDVLIKSFKRIAIIHHNWDLHIYGVGKLKLTLNELIAELKLEDRVFLNGLTDNIYSVYASSDLFVMSSAYEGVLKYLIEVEIVLSNLLFLKFLRYNFRSLSSSFTTYG